MSAALIKVACQLGTSSDSCLTYFGEGGDEDPEGDDEGQLHPLELHVEHLGRGDSMEFRKFPKT